MHITLSDVGAKAKYHEYRMEINGAYHSTVRYSESVMPHIPPPPTRLPPASTRSMPSPQLRPPCSLLSPLPHCSP
jgi:hypothetical protein